MGELGLRALAEETAARAASPGARRRHVGVLGVALIAVAWSSAGIVPLREAATEALAPADFTRDFVTAHARLALGRALPLPGEEGNALAVALGAPEVVLLGGPYYLHPPPALFVAMAFVPLGFRGAALAWVALTVIALGALAFGLVALATDTPRPRLAWVTATFLGLLVWPPVLHNLAKGQWSVLLAALLTLGWRALEERRPRAMGAWVGVAVCLKLTPILFVGYLARRDRRAIAVLVALSAVAIAASLAANGTALFTSWVVDVPRDVAAWQTWPGNTASLNGLVARWLAGGAFARPLVATPSLALARGANALISLGLLGSVIFATWRAAPAPDADRALGAAWLVLVVLLNPLAWTHTEILALPALALLRGIARADTLVAAFAVMSIPRQTLVGLAGPAPISPAAAPLLSLHALALLLVLGAALRAAHAAAPLTIE